MSIVTYTRVSTKEQEHKIQLESLKVDAKQKNWTISKNFYDQGVSGGNGRDRRKGFDDLCKAIERGEVKIIMAWSVDRVSRTVLHLIEFFMLCQKHNVQVYFKQNPSVSTTDPTGMAIMQVFGVFAELDRKMISARQKESYEYRRATGNHAKFGRAFKFSDEQRQQVLDLQDQGLSCRDIAAELGMGLGTVGRIVKAGAA